MMHYTKPELQIFCITKEDILTGSPQLTNGDFTDFDSIPWDELRYMIYKI